MFYCSPSFSVASLSRETADWPFVSPADRCPCAADSVHRKWLFSRPNYAEKKSHVWRRHPSFPSRLGQNQKLSLEAGAPSGFCRLRHRWRPKLPDRWSLFYPKGNGVSQSAVYCVYIKVRVDTEHAICFVCSGLHIWTCKFVFPAKLCGDLVAYHPLLPICNDPQSVI